MKIIILGAGQVGSTVAQHLAREETNDVTLIDIRDEILQELRDRLDIRTVQGHACHPQVLKQAGAAKADLLMALTTNDEANLLACHIACILFRIPTKIARIRALEYLDHPRLFTEQSLRVDLLINPEQLVTEHIRRTIEDPGALQVLDFSGGKVRLVATKVNDDAPLVGEPLRNLHQHLPGIAVRIAAVFREGRATIPSGDTIIRTGDEVFFVTERKYVRAVMSELRRPDKPLKRIIVAGAGHVGRRLAKALENRFQVKVIDKDPACAQRATRELARTIVLTGDAGDEELLREENIEHTDLFCAVTNDDEANILSAMLAKRLGARMVMSLINRPSYLDLMQEGHLDTVISPQQATISRLLTYVRRGDVVKVHSLRGGAAEAIEAVVHGEGIASPVLGRRIDEIKLPAGIAIVAIVRGENMIIAHHDTRIQAGDHVILFLMDKKRLPDVERLFQAP